MGIDFYIEDEQIRLTSAYFFNEFLNWTAEQGEYPQILDHSPIHGSYSPSVVVSPGLYSGSIQALQRELRNLLLKNPPDYARYVIEQMLLGCNLALKKKVKITMDDGAWDERDERDEK